MATITRLIDPEALVWLGALVILGTSNPQSDFHFTLFWPALFFDIPSPGYNLGHSISYLLHGDVWASIDTHWLGIPTTFVLVLRILSLTRHKIRFAEKGGTNYG